MLIYVGLSVPDFLSNFQEVAYRLYLRLLGKNILSAPLSFARTLTYPAEGVLGGGSPLGGIITKPPPPCFGTTII